MTPPLLLRPLQLDDLDAVMAIEEQVFPLPWSRRAYESELRQNPDSHYFALQVAEAEGLQGLDESQGLEASLPAPGGLLGYGGFWMFGEEAHLVTIAIDPRWQGKGLGAWLLLKLLEAAQDRGAALMTLEVRAGNRVAQSLYRQFAFKSVGLRRHYYADNGEDALIMTSPDLSSPAMLGLCLEREANLEQRLSHWLAHTGSAAA